MNRRIHIAAAAAICLVAGCGEESPEQQLMKGMQSAAEGDETAALAFLDHSVALAPNDANLLIVRGGLYDSLGNTAAAIADYE